MLTILTLPTCEHGVHFRSLVAFSLALYRESLGLVCFHEQVVTR